MSDLIISTYPSKHWIIKKDLIIHFNLFKDFENIFEKQHIILPNIFDNIFSIIMDLLNHKNFEILKKCNMDTLYLVYKAVDYLNIEIIQYELSRYIAEKINKMTMKELEENIKFF